MHNLVDPRKGGGLHLLISRRRIGRVILVLRTGRRIVNLSVGEESGIKVVTRNIKKRINEVES